MATFGIYDFDISELEIEIEDDAMLEQIGAAACIQWLEANDEMPNKAINLDAVRNQTWSGRDMVEIITMFAHRLRNMTDIREDVFDD